MAWLESALFRLIFVLFAEFIRHFGEINREFIRHFVEINRDFLIGFRFHPTYEELIRIVIAKNNGRRYPPIFVDCLGLFQCQPDQLEECYCFTKLEPLGTNKVKRTVGDGSSRYWKNIKSEVVTDEKNNKIGSVTKLKLHEDKNTTTEWHILEYRDSEMQDAGRWVLCQIYKREKNNDSGSPAIFAPHIDNTTVPHQIPSSAWASGNRENMNQSLLSEVGQCSNTQQHWISRAATNSDLTGGHMYQDQIHGVDQSSYSGHRENMNQSFVYEVGQCSNTQQDLISNPATNSDLTGGHMVQDQIHGVDQSSYSGHRENMNQSFVYEVGQCSNTQQDLISNPATNSDLTGGHMYQDQIHGVDQSSYNPQDDILQSIIKDFEMALGDDQGQSEFNIN